MRDISATVRSSAHVIIVRAKMPMAMHTAHIMGAVTLNVVTIGAMSVPNVANRPNIRSMSAAFTSTASRKIYFGFVVGATLA